jgi:hypothetical protein
LLLSLSLLATSWVLYSLKEQLKQDISGDKKFSRHQSILAPWSQVKQHTDQKVSRVCVCVCVCVCVWCVCVWCVCVCVCVCVCGVCVVCVCVCVCACVCACVCVCVCGVCVSWGRLSQLLIGSKSRHLGCRWQTSKSDQDSGGRSLFWLCLRTSWVAHVVATAWYT